MFEDEDMDYITFLRMEGELLWDDTESPEDDEDKFYYAVIPDGDFENCDWTYITDDISEAKAYAEKCGKDACIAVKHDDFCDEEIKRNERGEWLD